MELNELKDIWKKTGSDFQPKPEAELALMLRGNSKSVVAKLKRSVWFELIFTFVSGVALLLYALTLPGGSLKWISVSILVMLVAYSVYYIKKLMVLNRFNNADENLKASLTNLIETLISYLRFYKLSYTILYPVYFVLALVFVGLERGIDELLNLMSKAQTIINLIVVAAIFYISSTWFVKWYLKKLYGRHVDKLTDLLNDLNSINDSETLKAS